MDVIEEKIVREQPKKKGTKQYTGLRIMTRKIMRNKLKFELKKLGFTKVNKNFRQILSNMSDKEIIKLFNK